MKSRFNILYEQVMNSLLLENRKDDYLNQLKQKNVNDAESLADQLFSLNDPKKEKCFLRWILKGSVIYPEDSEKMEQAYDIINKQHLDMNNFDLPDNVINRKESNQILARTLVFDPDKEPTFTNKQSIGPGIVAYFLEDSRECQKAVRKAIDYFWGYDKNPWCLAARKDGILRHNADEIEQMTDAQKEKLGLYSDDELETSWGFWKTYSAYPKRIAFKYGKLFAFSADKTLDIFWWDKKDEKHKPNELNIDDSKFEKEYILDKLPKYAKSKKYKLRAMVAKYKNTPIDILRKLSKDENVTVKHGVAENENISEDILRELSKDENIEIKEAVIENKNTSIDILRELSKDELGIIRIRVAKNKNTPIDILRELSKDESSYVRYNVAGNKNTPIDVLRELSKDEDKDVRKYVALNKNTPIDVLRELSKDEDKMVRIRVASNENTPIDILIEFSKNKDKDIRYSVSTNENIPINGLIELSKDEDGMIREKVAKNKNTPIDILIKLSKDKDKEVREDALENLRNRR